LFFPWLYNQKRSTGTRVRKEKELDKWVNGEDRAEISGKINGELVMNGDLEG
jgi:hypothetical protein